MFFVTVLFDPGVEEKPGQASLSQAASKREDSGNRSGRVDRVACPSVFRSNVFDPMFFDTGALAKKMGMPRANLRLVPEQESTGVSPCFRDGKPARS